MESDTHTLTQATVLEKSAPPQGGTEADSGEQVGYRNSGTPEVDEGILPGRKILKCLFFGNTHNGFNKLSRLAILCTFRHQ